MTQIPIKESLASKILFTNTKSAWFWLIVRLYVGWEWLYAGYEKVINPMWVGSGAGKPIVGFVQGALQKTDGAHPDVTMWYAWFLENLVLPYPALWSHLVSIGEVLVGAGLILGAFTGIAAFFGVFMNMNYLLAGTVSSNPILLILGIGIALAWRVAGYIGLDRYLLKFIGTPQNPGTLFNK
jgi:thiosulfate dehydrogenase (quinone) large subunit